MPFVEYRVLAKSLAGGTGLSVSLQKLKENPAKLSILLSSTVAAQFGWGKGDAIAVLLGTDEQHGLLRLRKAVDGTALVIERNARGGPYFQVQLGHIGIFVDRKEDKRYCKFEEVDAGGSVEIVLPKWAEETHPTRRAVSATRPMPVPERRFAESRPPLGRRAIDLTGSLQGDPAPGRSALANRGDALAEREALRRAEGEGRRQSEQVSREALLGNRNDSASQSPLQVQVPSPTEKRILAVLIDAMEHSNMDLARAVGTISHNSVPANISNLRKKLRIGGITIETVTGGFMMKPDMAERARALLLA